MLRLRSSILAHLLSSPSTTYPISSHNRLLSAAAPRVPPNPSFAVEEYLVDTCGLTRAQALKASGKLSHVDSPTNPNAVLAFLAGLGLSSVDVAAAVAKDPKFLCTSVERTLDPIVVGLTDLGLSRSEIARLAFLAPASFRCKSILSNLPYLMSLFGSYQNLLRLININSSNLRSSLEMVVKPNVTFLRECGLGACDIAKLCINVPRLLESTPDRLEAIVARAEGLGVPRGSAMFRHALSAVGFRSEENISAKLDDLKKTLRWSNAELGIALCKNPMMLTVSKDVLHSKSEFLISEVGLQPIYIAHQPSLLNYSLEGRLKPRYYVIKFLKKNGLTKRDSRYGTVVKLTEKLFLEKFICPYKELAPHLSEDYAAACRGEVPTSFRFI